MESLFEILASAIKAGQEGIKDYSLEPEDSEFAIDIETADRIVKINQLIEEINS